MISVCMITHNGEEFIREQIDSILTQIGDNDELIISDDGSIDDTVDLINSYNDKRIKLLSFSSPDSQYKGKFDLCYRVGRNMENALKNARGEIIIFSDQDDKWLSGRVERILERLSSYDLVCFNCCVGDENLNIMEESYFSLKRPPRGLIDSIIRTPFLGCCMAFKSTLLKIAMPFPKEPVMHDLWLGVVGCTFGRVICDEVPSLIYRRHLKNVSSASAKSKNGIKFKLLIRVYITIALTKLVIRRLIRDSKGG